MSHSISDDSLQRFLDGISAADESRSIVAHLLRGCTACAAKLRAAIVPDVPPETYDAVFARLTLPASLRPVLRFERSPAAPPRRAVHAGP
jgi:hypothetical protein